MSAVEFGLSPVDLTDVKIDSAFWTPRQEVNRTVTLAAQYKMCKDTGRIDAFRLDWKPDMPNKPHYFWDSDLAKWIEAACYSLATHPDADLEKQVDDVIALIASAQQSDGYLNVYFTIVAPEKRWINLRDFHELYCAGHLIEAAVAHYKATGKRTLLDVMCRYVDHIDSMFGREEGKKRGYCGHEEIELALVKLYQLTGDPKHLRLAKYFVDERGTVPHFFDAEAIARGETPAKSYVYSQAQKPLRELDEVGGHAVRAFYIYTAMADVAALTHDEALLAACKRLWADATLHKMYITGAVGPSAHNEGFTKDYDLPNETAYAETCANIALAFFAHRMLHIEGDARYADVIERILYNSSISGVNMKGDRFFYCNPLASSGSTDRKDWFGCACCPPNLARLLASLGGYVYSTRKNALYVQQYIGGTAKAQVAGRDVTLSQETNYPWDGDVQITVGLEGEKAAKFDLMLRLPSWCRKHKLTVNGKAAPAPSQKGYLRVARAWSNGDVLKLALAMPVERVVANPLASEDLGKVAMQRGPIVYCLEQPDNTAPVRQICLSGKSRLTSRFDKKTLGGVVVVEGQGMAPTAGDWKNALYHFEDETQMRKVKFKAIPYAFWNNRGAKAMTVWMPKI